MPNVVILNCVKKTSLFHHTTLQVPKKIKTEKKKIQKKGKKIKPQKWDKAKTRNPLALPGFRLTSSATWVPLSVALARLQPDA